MNPASIILLSFIPGFGHMLSGRLTKGGTIWGMFMTFAIMAYVRGLTLKTPASTDWLFMAFLIAGGVTWAWSIVDALDFTYGLGKRADPDEVDRLMLAGLVSYMRNDLDAAAEHLRQARRLTPREPAIAMHLATIALAQSDASAAKRAFRRCDSLDEKGYWTFDLNVLRRCLAGKPDDDSASDL